MTAAVESSAFDVSRQMQTIMKCVYVCERGSDDGVATKAKTTVRHLFHEMIDSLKRFSSKLCIN